MNAAITHSSTGITISPNHQTHTTIIDIPIDGDLQGVKVSELSSQDQAVHDGQIGEIKNRSTAVKGKLNEGIAELNDARTARATSEKKWVRVGERKWEQQFDPEGTKKREKSSSLEEDTPQQQGITLARDNELEQAGYYTEITKTKLDDYQGNLDVQASLAQNIHQKNNRDDLVALAKKAQEQAQEAEKKANDSSIPKSEEFWKELPFIIRAAYNAENAVSAFDQQIINSLDKGAGGAMIDTDTAAMPKVAEHVINVVDSKAYDLSSAKSKDDVEKNNADLETF